MPYAWEYWDMEHKTTNLERESLEAHVDLCSIRYDSLDKRLTVIEAKVDEIHQIIDDFKSEIVKIAFKSAIGIVSALCVTVWVIKF
jgi:hypothetical protein